MANFGKSDLSKFKYMEKLAQALVLKKEIEFIVKDTKYSFVPEHTREVLAFIKRPNKSFLYKNGEYIMFFKSNNKRNSRNPQEFKFTNVNKAPFSGVASKAGKETKMQELAFNGACANDYQYVNKVHPTISKDWLQSINTSSSVFLKYIRKNVDISEMSRDEGSAKLIKDTYKRLKENIGLLNPSDVWYTSKKYKTLKRDLKQIISLQDLNRFLLEKMTSKELIGISLKKTKKAKISLLNCKEYRPRKDAKISLIKLNLEHESLNKFKTQDCVVKIDGMTGSAQVQIQIKANSLGNSNLKYECTSKGALARLGKAPVKQVQDLIKYKNNWREQSTDVSRAFKMFKSVQKMTNFETDLKDYSQLYFEQNMTGALINCPEQARNKLMMLEALYSIQKTQESDVDIFVQIVDLSQKLGKVFSPFLKIS